MKFLVLAMFLLPVVAFAVFAARIRRLIALMRNPEQLGQLLSDPVRHSLATAGIDPNQLELAQLERLEADPELRQQIRDELGVAFKRILAGRRAPGRSSATLNSPLPPVAVAPSEAWNRPLPIDHASRQARFAPIIAIGVTAILIAIFVSLLEH